MEQKHIKDTSKTVRAVFGASLCVETTKKCISAGCISSSLPEYKAKHASAFCGLTMSARLLGWYDSHSGEVVIAGLHVAAGIQPFAKFTLRLLAFTSGLRMLCSHIKLMGGDSSRVQVWPECMYCIYTAWIPAKEDNYSHSRESVIWNVIPTGMLLCCSLLLTVYQAFKDNPQFWK